MLAEVTSVSGLTLIKWHMQAFCGNISSWYKGQPYSAMSTRSPLFSIFCGKFKWTRLSWNFPIQEFDAKIWCLRNKFHSYYAIKSIASNN